MASDHIRSVDPSINPYQVSGQSDPQRYPPKTFPELSFSQLRKLRDHSRIIFVLGMLWTISSVCWLGAIAYALLVGFPNASTYVFFYVLIAVLMMVSSYASFRRPGWGRYLCMLQCVLLLIGIPIGTLIGIIGLVTLSNAKRLFGDDRDPHRLIDEEFRYRKEHHVFD